MELINRELSWLAFNERVLQEAMDTRVPLIERMRFLGIYSSNMDEFFRVRVANLKRIVSLKSNSVPGFKGTAQQLLEEIRKEVIRQQKEFESTFQQLVVCLAEEQIIQLNETNLSESQRVRIQHYFHEDLKHVIVPIILDPSRPFPKLRDKSIYLAVRLEIETKKKPLFALIEIPSNYPRFFQLQEDEVDYFILIDDIIRLNLESIFTIFEVLKSEAYTFKFTRDAELNIDDDLSVSFIEKIEKSLKLRKKGIPVRFVYDSRMPLDLKNHLLKSLDLKSGSNAIPGGKYHNFKDFARFPNFGKQELVFSKQPAVDHPRFVGVKSFIKEIYKQDVLLHFPYQRFDHVVDLLREAALDPKVKTIRINIYRVAGDSQIMNALMNAVNNGKEVLVIVELQARFDEENNLYWAEKLKEIGAKVIVGVPNLKVHSKLMLISRESKGHEKHIAYIGTGNFHEKTANIYSDLGLLTANHELCSEVRKVFRIVENSIERGVYKHLLVSPINNRRKINALIQREITNAKSGLQAGISIKINNLVDAKIIEKLYEASCSGVQIRLIVRGVCSLVPGIKGQSENIEVISIVGRFLEHARFFIFENNGSPVSYISSADMMERNLDRRIEVGAPILDETLQDELRFLFETQWNDGVKARIVDKKLSNKYKRTSQTKFDSQELTYAYYKSKLEN